MAGTTSGRLARSLYVGTTTSSRSATLRTASEGRAGGSGHEHDDPGCGGDRGRQVDDLWTVAQDQAMLTASAQGHGHQRMVGPNDWRGSPVELGDPRWVVSAADRKQGRP